MGGCQNCGTFLGTLNIRCRIIIGIQKGTIILTTTHVGFEIQRLRFGVWGLTCRVEDLRFKVLGSGSFTRGPYKKEHNLLGST